MNKRAVPSLLARELSVAAIEGQWSLPGLLERFETVTSERGTALAHRVFDLMPAEPLDGVDGVYRLLVELPELPGPDIDLLLDEPAPRWIFGVPQLASVDELAAYLSLTVGELDWFADEKGWLRDKSDPLAHYVYHSVPKRDGVRLIEAPKLRLRELQRKVLRRILQRVPVHAAAHGFRSGRSAITFAQPHAGADVVFRMDLRHFFPTIAAARVRAVFAVLGYPPAVASALTGLCTTRTPAKVLRTADSGQTRLLRARHLPQGAPTSPALANLAARGLDRRLSGLARAKGLQYSRYADDLAFSGAQSMNVDAVLWAAGKIVVDEGFTVHPSKTRVLRSNRRQQLAGLVVNSHPVVRRSEYDDLRALLHNCRQHGPASQNRHAVPDFRAHVYGRIAWMGASSAPRRAKLLELAEGVRWAW